MSGQDILKNSGMTGCFSKAGLAEGTNSGTIKTAAPNGAGIDYAIHGVAYHQADTDNIAVTAHPQQAAGASCLYLVQIDKDGTVSTKKGNEVETGKLGVNASLQWSNPDEDKCAIGGYKIATNSTTTFTNGTTDLGASGITDTFYDFIGGVPSMPQVS